MTDPLEVLNLTDELIALATELRDALAAQGPGGRRITRREARRLAVAALGLAHELIRVLL